MSAKATHATEVFLDTSIVLTGGERIGLAYAPEILKLALEGRIALSSDAMAVQEAAEMAPRSLFDLFRAALFDVLPVTAVDLAAGRALARAHPAVSPRTCLHVAVMSRHGIGKVCALAGVGYEAIESVDLVAPREVVALWRSGAPAENRA